MLLLLPTEKNKLIHIFLHISSRSGLTSASLLFPQDRYSILGLFYPLVTSEVIKEKQRSDRTLKKYEEKCELARNELAKEKNSQSKILQEEDQKA